METEPREDAWRARADLLMAIGLVVLGLAVFYLSWTMPRLENRHIHPATIPGLVPMFLSAALVLCGGMLGLRAARLEAQGGWQQLAGLFTSRAAVRIFVILALALIHTLVLVGWLPFWAAAMLFIFAFIALFETWFAEGPPANLPATLAWALGIAVVAGFGIDYVFGRIFLVRLP